MDEYIDNLHILKKHLEFHFMDTIKDLHNTDNTSLCLDIHEIINDLDLFLEYYFARNIYKYTQNN